MEVLKPTKGAKTIFRTKMSDDPLIEACLPARVGPPVLAGLHWCAPTMGFGKGYGLSKDYEVSLGSGIVQFYRNMWNVHADIYLLIYNSPSIIFGSRTRLMYCTIRKEGRELMNHHQISAFRYREHAL
jgi:hypothetical protein